MIQIIHCEIWSDNFTRLNNLINIFQSCVRFCYSRFSKENMSFNDVRRIAKIKYPIINSTQIADAVLQGQTCKNVLLAQQKLLAESKVEIENKLNNKITAKVKIRLIKRLKNISKKLKYPKLIFGGRNFWQDYKSGKITKNEWLNIRNSQIYSRGSKDNQMGNQNLRVIGNTLRVNIGRRDWVFYKLFIPNKFQAELKQLLASGCAYNVRLIRKDEQHFRVIIDYQAKEPITTTKLSNGAIGVDTNPDRIAIAEISSDGNLISTDTLVNNRILYARTEKRDYDIGCLVKQITNKAIETNKGIIFEDLKFSKDKEGSIKWKRKQSNFVWKKFITLLEAKCIEKGIEYKKVNPAYTSIIGKYKYRWMHKITIHESAAYVIGRRGLGFNEKLSFYKTDSKKLKELVFRTLAGKYKNKKVHSWSLWKCLNDNIDTILTGLQVSLADLKEFVGNIWYRGENLRSEIFLQELLIGSSQ